MVKHTLKLKCLAIFQYYDGKVNDNKDDNNAIYDVLTNLI